MAVYEEIIKLKDEMSPSAKSAGEAVLSTADKMKILSNQVTATQAALVKAQASGNIAQYKKLTQDLDQYKSALTEMTTASESAAGGQADLQAELAEMSGGLSIVAEAAAAAAAAIGVVIVAGAKMAIEASEAKAKMTSLFDALGGGQIQGQEVVGMLDDLSDKIGVTRDQLAPLTQQFLTMGITGKEQLEGLTLAAASANSMIAGGGDAFTKLFGQINTAAQTGQKLVIPAKKLDTQLRAMGLNVGDLAAKMNMSTDKLAAGLKAGTLNANELAGALTAAATDKGAGTLARAGASLTNVWAKFQENIAQMFEDIDVGPFLEQVKQLFDIFGQAKPSGQAMKAGIGGFFKQVFEQATKVVPLVKHFLLDMVIWALKAYIAAKPIVAWIKDVFAQGQKLGIVGFVLNGLLTALKAIAVAIGVVVAVFVGMAAIAAVVAGALWGVIGAIVAFVSNASTKLAEWASGATTAAKNFIAGLVNGIAGGAADVVKGVGDLANKAKDAFKSVLGIHSPSTVMMDLGGHVAGGVAKGMAAQAPEVHAASGDLAKAASGGFDNAGGQVPAANAGKGGGTTINVSVQIDGAGKSAMGITEEMVSLVFERMALAQGLG